MVGVVFRCVFGGLRVCVHVSLYVRPCAPAHLPRASGLPPPPPPPWFPNLRAPETSLKLPPVIRPRTMLVRGAVTRKPDERRPVRSKLDDRRPVLLVCLNRNLCPISLNRVWWGGGPEGLAGGGVVCEPSRSLNAHMKLFHLLAHFLEGRLHISARRLHRARVLELQNLWGRWDSVGWVEALGRVSGWPWLDRGGRGTTPRVPCTEDAVPPALTCSAANMKDMRADLAASKLMLMTLATLFASGSRVSGKASISAMSMCRREFVGGVGWC